MIRIDNIESGQQIEGTQHAKARNREKKRRTLDTLSTIVKDVWRGGEDLGSKR